jgi:hypothetical protein
MKRPISFLLVAVLGFFAGTLTITLKLAARHARKLDAQRVAWETEKAELEAALASARARRTSPSPGVIRIAPATPGVPVAAKLTPEELLHRLAEMKIVPGPERTRAVRQILVLLDQLAQAGPEALPAIRQFLATNADVEFDRLAEARVPRDIRALTDAVLPFSLRLALFDVVRQIGGEEAEKLLAETLGRTGRGLEIACLTQLLEEMAPGKYRDTALAVAQALLNGARTDNLQRDYLFSVLRRFNDVSFASTAQAQLVQADGRIDRGALRYLQQSLGEQSVSIAAQFYKDGRITDADSREPLARVALTYVGASEPAAQLWHAAINDLSLKPAQRRELVLDLDQDGLQNDKTPTPTDLPIVANRLALTQAYLQQDFVQNDPVLNKAFLEANKDLQKLLERGTAAASAASSGAVPAPPGK